jgi:hypothetical protein
MGKQKLGIGISYWRLLRQPAAAFRWMLRSSQQEVLLVWVVLSGFCMVLLWADVFNKGIENPAGQVMSVTLVAGPILGIAFMLLSCLLSMSLANLLDRSHRTRFQFRTVIPPFPLKNLLFRRVLGTARLNRLFSYPLLRQGRWVYSWLRAQLVRARLSMSNGRVEYSSLLAWHSGVARAWVPVGAILWLQHFLLDQPVLVPGSMLQVLWWLAALPFIALFAYHNAVAIQAGFGLGWMRSWLILGLSWAMSLGALLFLLSFLTGMSLF